MTTRTTSSSSINDLAENSTRFLFFTGKGGVGKTSLACAIAVALADQGRKVLLVSTDPASNLDHVFEVVIGEQEPTSIMSVPNLVALNINPEAAAKAYRERLISPVRGLLPEQTVRHMEEQLSGACTTEIAAFDEFTGLLANSQKNKEYDHIVFDTAPTGHTLRLLKLPGAWSNFLDTSQSSESCLGPLAGLEKQRQLYHEAVDSLADVTRTTIILVSRPQRAALQEAARTGAELAALNILSQRLIINGLMPLNESRDSLAKAMVRRDSQALQELPDSLQSLPTYSVHLQSFNLVGVEALRSLIQTPEHNSMQVGLASELKTIDVNPLRDLVAEMEASGTGLIMVMGKGGVGKTTIAAAIAVELAARGHKVHLTTTDPAANVVATVETEFENLSVSRIDPKVETERYRRHIIDTKGSDLDAQGLAMLEEDLRSPCTEEIAVFQAFSKVVYESSRKFVVMDTAPTGHTLLLLDATGAYHREIMRHTSEADRLITPMMRLQDPKQTKILVVTLPETTPVLEAKALQEDLRRAGIEPWAWIINGSLAAAKPSDPLLLRRAISEYSQIEKVQNGLSKRVFVVPWLAEEPVGPENLARMIQVH